MTTTKKKRNGKASFVSWKNCTFDENCKQGQRSLDAWFCCFMLMVLSTRKRKIRKTGTYVDWIIPMLIKAWKTQDIKFFKDIAATLKRSNTYVAASLQAQKLSWDYFDVHQGQKKSYSLGDIMKICGIGDKQQARRVRKSFNEWLLSRGGT